MYNVIAYIYLYTQRTSDHDNNIIYILFTGPVHRRNAHMYDVPTLKPYIKIITCYRYESPILYYFIALYTSSRTICR